MSKVLTQHGINVTNFLLRYVGWVYDIDHTKNIQLPQEMLQPGFEFRHAIDEHTVVTQVHLWHALNDMVKANEKPLPPATRIVPTIVAAWNACKGGIDIYSRCMKNIKAAHGKMGPKAYVIIRMIFSLLLNAHITLRLFEVSCSLSIFCFFINYVVSVIAGRPRRPPHCSPQILQGIEEKDCKKTFFQGVLGTCCIQPEAATIAMWVIFKWNTAFKPELNTISATCCAYNKCTTCGMAE